MFFAGLLVLNEFHVKMADQLKDIVARLQKVGGLQSMDTGKKKKTLPEDGSQGRDAGSTGPVNGMGPFSLNPSQEETPESLVERLARKRKDHPEDGVSDVAIKVPNAAEVAPGTSVSPGVVPAPPSTLKDWISSIPPPMRRKELFDKYAFIQEKWRFRKENFDDFLQRLTDEVTLVKIFLLHL